MIVIEGLVKQLGGRRVADGLQLQVDAGEVVVVSGPSGSGKTTLLRLIAGLEAADGGSIRLAGRCVDARDPPHRRGIGMLFQAAALWPHLSVADNILFGVAGQPRAWQQQRLAYLLERLGLGGYAARRPAELSGGEARRVALARALAPRRPILLADEPSANLDPPLRAAALALIADERREAGLAVLLASHEAEDGGIAYRRLRLTDGRLEPLA